MGGDAKRTLSLHCAAALVAATLYLVGLSCGQARAQGLLDIRFGHREAATVPSQALPYLRPDRPVTQPRPAVRPATASAHYCVRLCDGHFFPIVHRNAADAGELCRAFCPASQTRIFSGSGIQHSRAADGTRYASLQNAFVYRSKLLPDCTCNGRNHFGLAPIDPNADAAARHRADVALAKAAR